MEPEIEEKRPPEGLILAGLAALVLLALVLWLASLREGDNTLSVRATLPPPTPVVVNTPVLPPISPPETGQPTS